MEKQSEYSRLFNLLMEFAANLEKHINKKYRRFVTDMASLGTFIAHAEKLKDSVRPDRPKIGRQLIVVKLGLQSKEKRCVVTTLQYLLKLFEGEFIELGDPDYTENYVIGENEIRQQPVAAYAGTVSQLLKRLLTGLVHFRNDEINSLLSRNLQYLLAEDILTTILELSVKPPANYATLLYSFLSSRLYIYQQIHIYTERQLRCIKTEVAKDDRISKMIKEGLDRYEAYELFVEMYVSEIVDKVVKDGGKYGHCVICRQPADFHCKDTRASLCGPTCKVKHLELSNKYDQEYARCYTLLQQILSMLEQTMVYLQRQPQQLKSKTAVVQILNTILKKPYLFMLVEPRLIDVLKRYLPKLVSKLLSFKDNYYTELAFSIMCSVIKFWKSAFLDDIEKFLIAQVLELLQSKKPKYESLLIVYAFLAQLASNGRHLLELYANLDCRCNRENVIQRLMYQLGKILQDRFATASHFNKQERYVLKYQCLQIHNAYLTSLCDYRKENSEAGEVEHIMIEKNRKIALEKFVFKFNEGWQAGIKALYNLNLISMDDKELLDVLLTTARLKKSEIDLYLMDEVRRPVLKLFIERLSRLQVLPALVEYYKLFPNKEGSLAIKLFTQFYSANNPQTRDVEEQVNFWLAVFLKDLSKYTLQNFQQHLRMKHVNLLPEEVNTIFQQLPKIQSPTTLGEQPNDFRFSFSENHVQIIEGQLGLLQISLSHLLQTLYELPKTLQMAHSLQIICKSANLFVLLIKSTNLEYIASTPLTPQNVQIMNFLIEVPAQIPDHVQDWLPILRFYNDLYYFSLSACLTPVLLSNKTLILSSAHVNQIQSSIIKAATLVSVRQYPKLMLAVLKIAGMQSEYDRTLMLQKFFELFELNLQKSLSCWNELFPKLSAACLNNCFNLHSHMAIHTVDLLKQNILKVLKDDPEEQHERRYFQLLREIYYNAKHFEVKEFVVGCLSVLVDSHFQLYLSTWKTVLFLLESGLKLHYEVDGVRTYSQVARETVDAVIDKIMGENLRYLLDYYQDILALMMQLVTAREHKVAVKTLVNIRVLMDFLIKEVYNRQAAESPLRNKCKALLDKLLPLVLFSTAEKIGYDSHDTLFQVFFVLLKRNYQHQQPILPPEVVRRAFDNIYEALATNCANGDPTHLMIAQKFIQDNVGWAARMRHFYTLDCLAQCILGRYDWLSMLAIKGFKSFIQVLNPQTEEEWNIFTQVLLRVTEDCRLQNIKGIKLTEEAVGPNLDFLQFITNNRGIKQLGQPLNIQLITNQLLVQKQCLQLLPNDSQCLSTLLEIFQEVNNFNEHLQLRCVLWKKGFGKGSPELPSLLLLEEIAINRILSIYSCNRDDVKFYSFANDLLIKYCSACRIANTVQRMQQEQEWNNVEYELITYYGKHLAKRKQLLSKVVGYLLPKLYDAKLHGQMAVNIGRSVIDLIEFSEGKDLPIRLLRSLPRRKTKGSPVKEAVAAPQQS